MSKHDHSGIRIVLYFGDQEIGTMSNRQDLDNALDALAAQVRALQSSAGAQSLDLTAETDRVQQLTQQLAALSQPGAPSPSPSPVGPTPVTQPTPAPAPAQPAPVQPAPASPVAPTPSGDHPIPVVSSTPIAGQTTAVNSPAGPQQPVTAPAPGTAAPGPLPQG